MLSKAIGSLSPSGFKETTIAVAYHKNPATAKAINEYNVKFNLTSFPDRPSRTTRLSISLSYLNESKCEVVVEDLGFGEFYRATGMIVKETFVIDEIQGD